MHSRDALHTDAKSFLEEACDCVTAIAAYLEIADPEALKEGKEAARLLTGKAEFGVPRSWVKGLREVTADTYAAIMKDDDGVSPADRFFDIEELDLDRKGSEVLNSIRRARNSLFRADEKSGKEYKITDTQTATSYNFRTIDDIGISQGDFFLACIIPFPDGCWYSLGAIGLYGKDAGMERQIGISRRKQEFQEIMGREFAEHFKSRIATFKTREDCERAYDAFTLWQAQKRRKEKPETKMPDDASLPKFRLPHDISTPVTLFMTREGMVIGSYFAEYEELAAGRFDKDKRERMIESLFSKQELFPDPIFEIIYLEREDELLKLASEAFENARNKEDLREMILYFRPAIFDPCLPRLSLVGEGKEFRDIWDDGPQGEADNADEGESMGGAGTGYAEINDLNREEFYPLLQPIEAAIARCYHRDRKLKDRDVINALKSLRDGYLHGAQCSSALEREMLAAIGQALEKNGKFGSNDAVMCLRCILKSAKLHHQEGGSRGYLDFIVNYV